MTTASAFAFSDMPPGFENAEPVPYPGGGIATMEGQQQGQQQHSPELVCLLAPTHPFLFHSYSRWVGVVAFPAYLGWGGGPRTQLQP